MDILLSSRVPVSVDIRTGWKRLLVFTTGEVPLPVALSVVARLGALQVLWRLAWR